MRGKEVLKSQEFSNLSVERNTDLIQAFCLGLNSLFQGHRKSVSDQKKVLLFMQKNVSVHISQAFIRVLLFHLCQRQFCNTLIKLQGFDGKSHHKGDTVVFKNPFWSFDIVGILKYLSIQHPGTSSASLFLDE